MPPHYPSRQALQHLSRLCRSAESTPSNLQPSARRTLCSHLHSSRQQPLCTSFYPTSFHQTRSLATTAIRRVQSSPSTDTDPQNTATPILPDITNFYTLFPSTLPAGPPGPPPPEQSPATATSASNTPSATSSTSPTASSTPGSAPFTIHNPTLRREFLQLQSQHHPDKYATGSQAHQKALALSSLINNAYKTLSDPLLRAQYLLQLQYEVDVTSEDNAAHPTDQDTLMEVMEAQERVEEATGQDQIDGIRDENERRIVETERLMGEAFERGDVDRAKEECVRLKYWRSLQGVLHEWEPGKEVRLIH